MKIDLTRKNLVIELKESIKLENDQFIDKCINLVNKKYSISIESAEIREKLRLFRLKLREKYIKHQYNFERLIKSESEWLNNVVFDEEFNVTDNMTSVVSPSTSNTPKNGIF